MKMQRTRRKKTPSRGHRYLKRTTGSLETLESRNLLAANVLASVEGSIGTPGATNDVLMTLTLPDASPSATATMQINVVTLDGGFDPAAVTVMDQDNNIIPSTGLDDTGGTTASMTVVDLREGTYTLSVSDTGSTGSYRLDVSMLGDVEAADSGVSEFEELRTSAALLQSIGAGNSVTYVRYRNLGIDLNVDQYDPGMDANGNGKVDLAEFEMVEANRLLGTATVTLAADGTAPVISNLRLLNDTGVSGTDAITTDASLTADIADDNAIDELLISIDGGAEMDVRDMLGTLPGSFTLSQSLLESINGGPLSEGSHTIAINATDSIGNTTDTPVTTTFVFIADNADPVTSGIDDTSTLEDDPFTLDVSSAFSDPDSGDVLTFSATGVPSWATFSAAGVITGTPANQNVGTRTVTVTATDSQGATTSTSFDLTVLNVNDPPVVANIPDQTAPVDDLFELNILNFVDDVDIGDDVTVSVDQFEQLVGGVPDPQPLPDWLTYDEVTGILSGTPADGDEGTVQIVVRAVDSFNGDDFNTFDILVTNNRAPTLVSPIPDSDVDQDDLFSLNLNDFFEDNDPGDSITFGATLVSGGALPSWLSLSQSGLLSGTPDNDDVGSIMVEVTATDSVGLSNSDQFMLTVNNVNDRPTIEDQTFSVPMGGTNGTLVGTIAANDIDEGDTLSFSVTGGTGENAYAVDADTGEITIADATEAFSQNSFTLNVTVTDSGGLTADAVITLDVTNTDPTPMDDDDGFETDNQSELTIMSSDLLSNDTDPDGDTLTISMVDASSELGGSVSLSNDGTMVTYDPSSSATLAGLLPGVSMTDTFDYTVTDGRGGTATATVSVTVTGSSAIVEFTTSFADPEGTTITSVTAGENFQLVISVQDIRDAAAGVFSAYVDINYPAALVSVDGTFTHSTTYAAGSSGSTSVPGLLDEVGGTDGISPLGGDIFEVARITMRAGMTPGTVTFTGDIADDMILHPVTVFDITAALPASSVMVTSSSLTIESVPAPLGFSQTAPGTNPENAMDVNADGVVSPLDALVLINELNGTSESFAGIMYTDVNSDGLTSPIDALLVISHLNAGPAPHAAMSASVGSDSPLASDLVSDAAFESLENSAAGLNAPAPTGALGLGVASDTEADDEADEVDAVMSDFGNLPL